MNGPSVFCPMCSATSVGRGYQLGIYDALRDGDVIVSQGRTITESIATTAAWLGGYVHPLFTDHEHVRRHTDYVPPLVPGQFVLYLLGGLAEMTGTFDDTTLGLIALDEVRFERPVAVGDTIHLRMEVVSKRASSSGRRGSVRLGWRCVDARGRTVLTAVATMLFALEGDEIRDGGPAEG